MSCIYPPRGSAGEYSPLSLNLYLGCKHGCTFCFAKDDRETKTKNQKNKVDWNNPCLQDKINEEYIASEARKHRNSPDQVLLCFTTDPYMADFDTQLTTFAVEQFLENKIPIAILTKNPKEALRDLELFKRFGKHLIFGTTITTLMRHKEFEPNAPDPFERMIALQEAHNAGLKTWISLEPAFSIEESMRIIWNTFPFTGHYKVGKLNHRLEKEHILGYPVDRNPNANEKRIIHNFWHDYIFEIGSFLQCHEIPFYAKNKIRKFIGDDFFNLFEMNSRLFDAKPF
jgi:DNA repair photolyase